MTDTPPAWPLVGRGLWLGLIIGLASGLVVAPFVFLVPSLGGTAGDGGNLGYTVFLVLFGSYFVALAGAIVGVIAGAFASSCVYLALRLAVHLESNAPAGVVRMLGGAAGTAIKRMQ